MSLSPRLDLRQNLQLVMTPQLQQAIKLLQMSHQELGSFVAEELERNPLLEPADEPPAFVAAADIAPAPPVAATPDTPAPLDGTLPASGESHAEEWNGAHDDDDRTDRSAMESLPSGSGSGGGYRDEDDSFSGAEGVAEAPTLRDHVMEQIHVDFTDPAERLMATSLVDLLDDAGYLPAQLEGARAQLGATPAQFDSVIAKLQRLDPSGIFARSLQECLALQLREKNRLDPAMEALLANLPLVAKRDYPALMRLCGVDEEDLAGMLSELRALNPKPANVFATDTAPPLVPDVLLLPRPGGGWHVELNTETLPRVLVNERYYADIQNAAGNSATDKTYLSERWQQANWLVKALHQRATTILKVATEIVRQQEAFFIHGIQHLRPLVLRDIATAVEMHESTISRVTQNKYIMTPRGIFELKYFFSTALATTGGVESVSAETARARIKALVDAEPPDAILSDDKLMDLLRREGISLARRTVAKYREALKIPSSAARKRLRATEKFG